MAKSKKPQKTKAKSVSGKKPAAAKKSPAKKVTSPARRSAVKPKSKATTAKKPATAKKPVRKPARTKTPAAQLKNKATAGKKARAARKPAPKAAPAKKSATKSRNKPTAKKSTPAARKPQKAPSPSKTRRTTPAHKAETEQAPPLPKPAKLSEVFLVKQRQRLLELKDNLLDSMSGVTRDSLRSRADGDEASAYGMHQADAGSDAYDRDFALGLLSQDRNSLYEIDEALKRIEAGVYGVCEISHKVIPRPRLEAIPFTRYTVECQADIEKRGRLQRTYQPTVPIFGAADDEDGDGDDDSEETKD